MDFHYIDRVSQLAFSVFDMNGLHIDSLTKSYSGKMLLSDVYLSCNNGEIKGLMGRNGSGKSTLLKIVFGTERADSKFVRVGGKIIRSVSDGRNLINFLPQDNFLPNNVKIGTLIKCFLSTESSDILFKNEHVIPLLNKENQELSGGERRIIEILLILHSNARFVLLDEPFNGVGPILRDYIIRYINKMKPSKGFIITDHDHGNVMRLADKIVFLKDGFLRELNDKSEPVQ